jgi:hypothetical protein
MRSLYDVHKLRVNKCTGYLVSPTACLESIDVRDPYIWPGVDKTKSISGASPFFSGASIFFLQILAKKTMNLNLKIQAPGKNFQAPWRPGALYLSTPACGLLDYNGGRR